MSKQKKNNRNFFLISFLPAILYWYLEENYDVKIALIGGISLAVIEILFEKLFLKHIHKISIMNFFLIFFLGCLSLFFQDGLMFKLQPLFTGVVMGGVILISLKLNKSLFYDMMMEMNPDKVLPKKFILYFEKMIAFLLLVYGIFMGAIAIYAPTSWWLFFKTIGFYIISIFYIIGLFLYLKLTNKMVSLLKE